MAKAFIDKRTARQHDDAGGGQFVKFRFGLARPVPDLNGQRGKPIKDASGVKAMNVTAPTMISGAVSPIARERAKIVPVRMPGKA